MFLGGKMQLLEARKDFSDWKSSAIDRAHGDLIGTSYGFVETGCWANPTGIYSNPNPRYPTCV